MCDDDWCVCEKVADFFGADFCAVFERGEIFWLVYIYSSFSGFIFCQTESSWQFVIIKQEVKKAGFFPAEVVAKFFFIWQVDCQGYLLGRRQILHFLRVVKRFFIMYVIWSFVKKQFVGSKKVLIIQTAFYVSNVQFAAYITIVCTFAQKYCFFIMQPFIVKSTFSGFFGPDEKPNLGPSQ